MENLYEINPSEKSSNFFDKERSLKDVDEELLEFLKTQSSKIKVIGIGGGGGNSLSRMKRSEEHTSELQSH